MGCLSFSTRNSSDSLAVSPAGGTTSSHIFMVWLQSDLSEFSLKWQLFQPSSTQGMCLSLVCITVCDAAFLLNVRPRTSLLHREDLTTSSIKLFV